MSSASQSRVERTFSLLWLPLAFALSIPAYMWHQEFFQNTGPYYILIRGLPLLCVGALAYVVWARPYVRRFEIAALVVFPALVSAAVHPRAMCVAVGIAIAALALGDLITRSMRFESRDAPVAWAAGFGAMILLLALFGKVGLISVPWLVGLVLLLLLRAAFVWKRLLSWLILPFQQWKSSDASSSPATGICLFFLFLFVGCSLLFALTPIAAFDVLAYHFPLARYYSETHFIQPTPAIVQSYFPQGAETLMAIGFTLGGAFAVQLLIPFLGVLFLWVLVRTGRCCALTPAASVAGAAIASTFPFLHWTLSVPKDDGLLALFQLAALYGFLQWQQGRGHRWILLASFFLGQTAGIKHVALFGILAIAPLWLWAWSREKLPWRQIALAVILFAVSGFFWHIQTYTLTGNPLYPEGASRAVSVPHHIYVGGLSGPLGRYLTLPWYLQFRGAKAFESPSVNPLGMFLFLFAPVLLATLWRKWTPARKACLLFGLLYLAYWASVLSTLRYAIVPFALIALAGGAALVRLVNLRSRWNRNVVLLGFTYSFLFSLVVVMSFEVNSLEAAYLLDRVSAQEYLRQALPTTGSLFRLAAQHPGASVFGVTNCSRFYAPDPLRFACALCSESCRMEDVTGPLESRHYKFAILPASPDYQKFRDALAANFGAKAIDTDGRFVTLMLDAKHSPDK